MAQLTAIRAAALTLAHALTVAVVAPSKLYTFPSEHVASGKAAA